MRPLLCLTFARIDLKLARMDLHSLGNTIYLALKDDLNSETLIRKERAALALTLATDPDASARVTSSTVNGQSFTVQNEMKSGQRLKLLSHVVACFNHGGPISRTSLTTFTPPASQ